MAIDRSWSVEKSLFQPVGVISNSRRLSWCKGFVRKSFSTDRWVETKTKPNRKTFHPRNCRSFTLLVSGSAVIVSSRFFLSFYETQIRHGHRTMHPNFKRYRVPRAVFRVFKLHHSIRLIAVLWVYGVALLADYRHFILFHRIFR